MVKANHSLLELLLQISKMREYLTEKIEFSHQGWPIFEKEHFLEQLPNDIVPFYCRNSSLVCKLSSVVICFYEEDSFILLRIKNVFKDIPVYQECMGVIVPDITITKDMDIEMQKVIMLVNQLFAAVLVVNGVKIVMNTRSASSASIMCFKNIPRCVMCSSSFLGCKNETNIYGSSAYINKILSILPSKLLIYGKNDTIVTHQLDLLGIEYYYFCDFHTLSKKKRGIA